MTRYQIRMDNPARRWDDGLPLGNGRLGAMVMGKPNEETIFINEETLWYGPWRDRHNPDALRMLPDIRRYLQEGDPARAQFYGRMALTSTPKYMNPYQPVGDLRICLLDHQYPVEDYSRTLDLRQAIAEVSYVQRNVRYRREHFVSQPHQVLAIRLTAGAGQKLTVSANISRKPFEEMTARLDARTAANWGQCGAGGVHYFSAVRVVARGGRTGAMGDFVYAEEADSVDFFLAAATDFDGRKDFRERCLASLDTAGQLGYEYLRQAHVAWHSDQFDQVELNLGEDAPADAFTPQLLSELKKDGRHARFLSELLFHFARYLLLASSIGCLLPANLQGIWNGEYTPPWECKFTININTEMNYWFADGCRLSGCLEPLFSLIDRLVARGRETARLIYGCRGFCAHHNTNAWANTDIEGIFDASPVWPMGGAWLCFHLYEHYLHSQDRQFLIQRALPVMREAILFFQDYLFAGPDGKLLTGPSLSPENTYQTADGVKAALCLAPESDLQILRQLLTWYLDGCSQAGCEDGTAATARDMLNRLPETKTGADGRILEWQEDVTETEPGHRHLSHLIALHPGCQIHEDTPELFRAAEKTLATRLENGSGHSGWSRAWVVCLYARLKNGRQSGFHLTELLRHSIHDNLLDIHPPFQIDGNFGAAEGIKEMLAQSHRGLIDILPALPPDWQQGHVRGIVLRGNIKANLSWSNGRLDQLDLMADDDRHVAMRYGTCTQTVRLNANEWTEVKICD